MNLRLTRRPVRTAAEAEALAAAFLADRRARHGDAQMNAGDDDQGTGAGGDDDAGKDGGQDGGAGDDDADDQGTDALGDAGKQALDRMKSQRNAARDELRAFKNLGLTVDQIKALRKPADADGKDDAGKVDVEEIRRETRAEAMRERVIDKIEAKAARGFADPEDAVAILLRGRKADDFLDGDKIDVEEIEDALKELLEKKPHLAAAAQGGSGRRFGGGADGGARNESRPEQLTRAQLAGMSPAEIEAARKAGRLNDLLGIKAK